MLSTVSVCNKALYIGRGIHLHIGIGLSNGFMNHISRVFPEWARKSKCPSSIWAGESTCTIERFVTLISIVFHERARHINSPLIIVQRTLAWSIENCNQYRRGARADGFSSYQSTQSGNIDALPSH